MTTPNELFAEVLAFEPDITAKFDIFKSWIISNVPINSEVEFWSGTFYHDGTDIFINRGTRIRKWYPAITDNFGYDLFKMDYSVLTDNEMRLYYLTAAHTMIDNKGSIIQKYVDKFNRSITLLSKDYTKSNYAGVGAGPVILPPSSVTAERSESFVAGNAESEFDTSDTTFIEGSP